MKAVMIRKPQDVGIVDIPRPVPRRGEVLIRLRALGLCGSDLASYKGLNPLVRYPRICGHEVAGEVVAGGEDLPPELAEGATVTVIPYTACGECPACQKGRFNACGHNQTMGVQRDGAAAEYICLPQQKVLTTEGLDFDQVACIEPLSVGRHAVSRGQVHAGEKIVVLGCGVIGLGTIAACAERQAQVTAVDIDSRKLRQAMQLGARYTVNTSRQGLKKAVQKVTNGQGPDVVIEAAGLAQTFQEAVDIVCFAGRVVYIGYVKQPVEYETSLFVSKELDIYGSRNALTEDFKSVIKQLRAGEINTDALITHRYRLEEARQAFRVWQEDAASVTKILLTT